MSILPKMITGIERETEILQDRISKLITIRKAMEIDPAKFGALAEHAIRVFEEDAAWSWLCRPILRLNYRSPLEAVLDGDFEEVDTLLSQLEYGVYI